EIETVRAAEAEQLKQIEEAEARLRAHEEARQSTQAKAAELVQQEQQLAGEQPVVELIDETQVIAIESFVEPTGPQVKEIAPPDEPWLQIDLEHSQSSLEQPAPQQVAAERIDRSHEA